MFDVTPQTVRTWCKLGLPIVPGTESRPRYPATAAVIWVTCYRRRLAAGVAGRTQTLADAEAEELEEQRRAWPDDFVCVPLDWDHPRREALLRLAAAGREPASAD